MTAQKKPTYIIDNLCDKISSLIMSGDLPPGDQLPSERELSIKHGISRMTARRIYERLEGGGFVNRSHRRGWFVAADRLHFSLMKSISFISNPLTQKRGARALALNFGEVIPPKIIQESLKIKNNKKVLFVERVLQLSDDPVALEYLYIKSDRFPKFLENDLNKSILSIWSDVYGVSARHIDLTVRGEFLSRKNSDLLKVPEGSPVIVLNQTIVDLAGEPFAYDRQDWRFELAEFAVSADFA